MLKSRGSTAKPTWASSRQSDLCANAPAQTSTSAASAAHVVARAPAPAPRGRRCYCCGLRDYRGKGWCDNRPPAWRGRGRSGAVRGELANPGGRMPSLRGPESATPCHGPWNGGGGMRRGHRRGRAGSCVSSETGTRRWGGVLSQGSPLPPERPCPRALSCLGGRCWALLGGRTCIL